MLVATIEAFVKIKNVCVSCDKAAICLHKHFDMFKRTV